jgi:hypothetical protein
MEVSVARWQTALQQKQEERNVISGAAEKPI